MSNNSLLPVASYNLALQPFAPVPAIEDDTPVTIRLTLAALDPEALDESAEPSTLRLLKRSRIAEEDNELLGGSSDEEDEEDELDDAEEKTDSKDAEEKEDNEDDDDEDDEEEDLDDDVDEFVICTLGPKIQYQQTLDLTLTPDEEVFFVVTGSYPIHLTGNYVEHPYDEDSDEDYDSEEEEESDEYNLTPDEDEVMDPEEVYALLAAQKEQEEPKIKEVEEKTEKTDSKKKEKKSKKREAEEPVEAPKKEKKSKNDKSVEFNKDLVQGPSASNQDKEEKASKKIPKKTLEGGIVIEDRTKGDGPGCKSGMRVGMRYIGKLKNGKVFDKNTSGKPFVFALGKGEVIKGWDVGVKGMAVGGERRIVIPAPMAYGKQKLPGIPANSELTFDVKLVSMK